MNPIKNIISAVSNKPVMMMLRKNSPKILLGVGIASGIATTVFACKGVLQVEEILYDHQYKKKLIEKALNDEELQTEYSTEDAQKDRILNYVITGKKFVKAFAPAIGFGALSVTSILGAYGILNKRIVGLTSAYAFVSGKFKEYRKNVIEDLGEDKDKEYLYGLKKETISVKEEVDGKKKTVKKEVVLPGNHLSQYAKCFDDASSKWQDDPELNLLFLRNQQNWANDKLRANGHLFLNEVYDALNLPRTSAGAIVGWIYDPDNPDIDNEVDFGIYSLDFQENRDFVNGYNNSIFLDFNVDGIIYDLIS